MPGTKVVTENQPDTTSPQPLDAHDFMATHKDAGMRHIGTGLWHSSN